MLPTAGRACKRKAEKSSKTLGIERQRERERERHSDMG
jgi:hypothetical protein